MTTTIYVDTTKAMAEFARMLKGEIPFNAGYLNELVESNDDNLQIEFTPTCDDCGSVATVVKCNECELLPRKDCSLCEGVGWWFECPNCDDGGILDGRTS